MDKTHSTLRKNKRPLRSQQNSQNEPDAEENRSGTQKMPLRDKCCQTDHHHHGCCEPAHELEPGDPPLLQRPVQTSKSGIQQIIECFRSGTKQLKHILLKEVDTIFECRSCRSLFRGLPNLITHKQFYCLPSVSMDGGHQDDNSKQSQAIRDLLEAIYPKADKQEYVINLEPIETNPNAVFQSATNIDNLSKNVERSKTSEETVVKIQAAPKEEIKLPSHTEVVEPQPVELAKKNASLITSGEEHTVLKPCSEMSDSLSSLPQFTCSVCAKVFNTRRSIYRHVSRVHKKKLEAIRKKCVALQGKSNTNAASNKGSKKLLYVAKTRYCHECHKTFATATNVRRHIEEVHKGIRREHIVPVINVKPKKPLHTQAVLPKKSLKGLTFKKNSSKESFGLSSFKCPHCKRKYSSQVLLKKHLQLDHKTTLSGVDTQRQKKYHNTSKKSSVTEKESQYFKKMKVKI